MIKVIDVYGTRTCIFFSTTMNDFIFPFTSIMKITTNHDFPEEHAQVHVTLTNSVNERYDFILTVELWELLKRYL